MNLTLKTSFHRVPTLLLALSLCLSSMLISCVEQEVVIDEEYVKKTEAPAEVITGPSIADLLASPEKYKGQELTVSGKVSAGLAFEFIDEQPYRINDGTGDLWVTTTGMVPEDETWTTVTGTFRTPYQIKGRRYKAALVIKPEESR